MHEMNDSRFIPLNELCLTLTGYEKGNGDKQNWNLFVHRRHKAENGPNDVREIKKPVMKTRIWVSLLIKCYHLAHTFLM